MQYISTGEVITSDSGFLMGHGTRVPDEKTPKLVATVSGFVERVNKLISVRAVNSRYTPEIGDVVVGRVAELGDKRWRVDVNARQHAVLLLSSVNLPGGVQRRRTNEDSLQMRTYFSEQDLISAEVQKVQHDGSVSLHTRSVKYGKLANGQFVLVPGTLIKRCKQHFHTLTPPIGVDIILGNNGYIWLSATPPREAQQDVKEKSKEEIKVAQQKRVVTGAERERVARVRNCIVALSRVGVSIHVPTILDVYRQSEQLGLAAAQILNPEHLQAVTQTAQARQQ